MRVLLAAVVVVAAALVFAAAAAPSPAFGDDCTAWCFSGSTVLQSEVFGSTNQWCPDSRGCELTWNISVVPCSTALLSFEARVGPSRVSFDTLDSATAASLGFYCSDSDVGATLELRAPGALPIMTWRYRATALTCARLLSDLRAAEPAFVSAEVAIALTVAQTKQIWFATGGEALSLGETECTRRTTGVQCFRGVDDLQVAHVPGWADACGPAAASCQVVWQFCLDAAAKKSTRAAIEVGTLALRDIASASARALVATCEDGDTPATPSAVVLSDGDTGQVMARWEYRPAPCAAMFYAQRRHAFFLSRSMSISRETVNGSLSTASILSTTAGGLDERMWRAGGTGEVGVKGGGAPSAESTESHQRSVIIGLSIGLGFAGLLAIGGWFVAVALLWRHYSSSLRHGVFVDSEAGAAPAKDTRYLHMSLDEQRAAGVALPSTSLLSSTGGGS
jgi:hypothetical protein